MIRVLVAQQANDGVIKWMVQPFRVHRVELLTRLGIRLRTRLFKNVADLPAIVDNSVDVVFLTVSWQEPYDKLRTIFEQIHSRKSRPDIVLLDATDGTNSPFFGLLPHVDLFVKKQLLQDLTVYREPLAGGFIVSDFVQERLGVALNGWHLGEPLPVGFERKLFLGWNLGTANFLLKQAVLSLTPGRGMFLPHRRKLDVHYRVGLQQLEPQDWYTAHRRSLLEPLRSLQQQHKVVAAAGAEARVDPDTFRRELLDAKLVVSPFGWGEITDRDFVAAINGSLLVKPDMSHLRTEPDIYVPGETYVPFKWDGSDLAEVCHWALSHPDYAAAMAHNARRSYLRWVMAGGFVRRVRRIMQRLDRLG